MAPIEIGLVGYQNPDSILNRASRGFGDALKARPGDEVAFRLTPDITRHGHKQFERPALVVSGEFAMMYQSTSYFTHSGAPDFGVLDLPYRFASHGHAHRALDGELGVRLARAASEGPPFRVLGFWDNGFRHLSNAQHPIRTPEDCRGLRIRTLTSPLHGEVFEALGMRPEVMDIATLLDRAKAGTIDAQDNPLTNIFGFGIQALQPHITMTGHIWGGSTLVVNRAVFDGWPPHVRTAVREAAEVATSVQRTLAAEEDERILASTEARDVEIVALTEAERLRFARAVQPVVDRHRHDYADLLRLISAAA